MTPVPKTWTSPDGRVVLMLANCLEVLPTLQVDPERDAVVTDPPYGIELANHGDARTYRKGSWNIAGDEHPAAGQAVVDWAGVKRLPLLCFASPKHRWAGDWTQELVWDKGEAVGGGGDPSTCWKFSHELIMVARAGTLQGRRDSSVLRAHVRQNQMPYHPTQKPLPLLAYLVGKLRAERIIDPFAGSGTTALACIKLHRQCLAMELDPRHWETAVERCQAETGAARAS